LAIKEEANYLPQEWQQLVTSVETAI